MAYTAEQYQAQLKVTLAANAASAAGTCVICGKPQAVWPSGVKRVTCGSEYCYMRWLAPYAVQFPNGKEYAHLAKFDADDI
jgi:hypothetical protein